MANEGKISTSVESQRQQLADALADLPIPEEAGSLNAAEKKIYQKFGQGKCKEDWFDHELIQLAELARVTLRIRRNRNAVKKEGDLVINRFGDKAANPRAAMIHQMVNQQLAIIRQLGLSSSKAQTKHHVINKARKEKAVRDNATQRPTGRPSLLAVAK